MLFHTTHINMYFIKTTRNHTRKVFVLLVGIFESFQHHFREFGHAHISLRRNFLYCLFNLPLFHRSYCTMRLYTYSDRRNTCGRSWRNNGRRFSWLLHTSCFTRAEHKTNTNNTCTEDNGEQRPKCYRQTRKRCEDSKNTEKYECACAGHML